MIELALNIVNHPYGIAVVLLALAAAYGFLYFFWGWSGYILAHGDKEHQAHARYQMVQGMTLLLISFSIWELVRYLTALFTGNEDLPPLTYWIATAWIVVLLYLGFKKLMSPSKKPAGGGH